MLTEILNQLFDYSNIYIEIKEDSALPIIAMSVLETNIHGRKQPVIIINPSLIPAEMDIVAYILAREFGHHFLEHVRMDSSTCLPSIQGRFEMESDMYASSFLSEYNYDKTVIISFIHDQFPDDYETRTRILITGSP